MSKEWPKVHAADYSEAIEAWLVMMIGVAPQHARPTFNEAAPQNQRAYASMAHIRMALRALGHSLESAQRCDWPVALALAEAYDRLAKMTDIRVCDETGEWVDTMSADPNIPLSLSARSALTKHRERVQAILAETLENTRG